MLPSLVFYALLVDAPPTAVVRIDRAQGNYFETREKFAAACRGGFVVQSVGNQIRNDLKGRIPLNTVDERERMADWYALIPVSDNIMLIRARKVAPQDEALLVNAVAEGLRLYFLELQRTPEDRAKNLQADIKKKKAQIPIEEKREKDRLDRVEQFYRSEPKLSPAEREEGLQRVKEYRVQVAQRLDRYREEVVRTEAELDRLSRQELVNYPRATVLRWATVPGVKPRPLP